MRVVIFCHSLRSDWNHGNAHFLRGVTSELLDRGHDVRVFEPRNGWSATRLAAEQGIGALQAYRAWYPGLNSCTYDLTTIDLDEVLEDANLVLVHEWNEPALIARIGRYFRQHRSGRVLFHDTHHRSVTARDEMRRYDLSGYDGVLAFGAAVRERYLSEGWARHVWVWHEAADVRVFFPRRADRDVDVIWIGNWGDEERTAELHEYLLDPVRACGASGRVHGVRYPDEALRALDDAGLEYRGWLPNYRVPEAFARARVTIHVPRRAYATQLPGIPTIRPFEALASGIPLLSAPWDDVEGLFTAEWDYALARTGAEMTHRLRDLLNDPEQAQALAANGRATILARHTCAHRVDELLAIAATLGIEPSVPIASSESRP
jgi:spore maturation protein CgeB